MNALRSEHNRNVLDGADDVKRRCVLVGGLHSEVDVGLVAAAFEPFGPIQNVSKPLGKQQTQSQSQQHRGLAFVEFAEHADAVAAIENMDQSELLGVRIYCRFAREQGESGPEGGNGLVV